MFLFCGVCSSFLFPTILAEFSLTPSAVLVVDFTACRQGVRKRSRCPLAWSLELLFVIILPPVPAVPSLLFKPSVGAAPLLSSVSVKERQH